MFYEHRVAKHQDPAVDFKSSFLSQGALRREEPVRIIRVKRIALAMTYQIVCLSRRFPLMS